MQSSELREKFIKFFEKNGHRQVASSSLLPSDPSVLFTTAGMQQFAPYLEGKYDALKDFGSRHLCSHQKCFRTNDIEEVGDDTHHTFFEMLGNWSIGTDENGHYFKEGAIKYALEFLVDELGLDKEKMWVTVFQGEGDIEKDTEAIALWQKYGIPNERIVEQGSKDNFWGPTAATGPCGPCSEIHYDRGEEFAVPGHDCPGVNCEKCRRVVEIWNLVFMQYRKTVDGKFEKLGQTNIDTGTGFERLLSILNNKHSSYETDLFENVFGYLKLKTKGDYLNNDDDKKSYRVIVDHLRGACFLIADGVRPSNLGQGYILRRVLRRAMFHFHRLDGEKSEFLGIALPIIEKYKDIYPEIRENSGQIESVINEESGKFYSVLEKGVEKFLEEFSNLNKEGGAGKMLQRLGAVIGAERSFYYHQSLGLTIEIQRDLAKENGYIIDEIGFAEELKKHQEISRAGAEKKFGGHGAGEVADEQTRYKITKLHSATHLLQEALRRVLGDKVKQMGSDINAERLRFDFSFDRKMTPEEIKRVEDLVNEQIKADLIVSHEEMEFIKAMEAGALAFFKDRYPDKVKVYSMGGFSKEVCGGPHVDCTGELGSFKILKEEASSSGVRRIKATVQ